MNNLTPEQLAFRAGYEQGRFDAQVETAQQRHISYVCPQCHWSLDKQPASKPWVWLTDEEVIIMSRYDLEYAALIGEVQRKLKEKNT